AARRARRVPPASRAKSGGGHRVSPCIEPRRQSARAPFPLRAAGGLRGGWHRRHARPEEHRRMNATPHRRGTRALLALATMGCASGANPSRVTPDALLASIRSGSAPVIVDVRTQREYDRGHVPGASHIPFYTPPAPEDETPVPPAETGV